MVSNVARLTRSLRDAVLEEVASSPASTPLSPRSEFSATALADKINTVRKELMQTGEAIFIDDRGNRFRIERKPA